MEDVDTLWNMWILRGRCGYSVEDVGILGIFTGILFGERAKKEQLSWEAISKDCFFSLK